MKNNRVGVWFFILALVAVGVASTGEVSERINMWLGKQAEPVMAEGETAGESAEPAAPDAAADTQAAGTEEAATPAEAETVETPSDEEAAEAAATPEADAAEASEADGEQAAASETGVDEQADAAPAADTAEPQAEAAADAAGASEEAGEQAEVIVPSFGLLRVEPDGSTLIAGSAGPNADIEILTRSETIATTKAEVNGDFVAVLDDPLEPGDYEIVLRSTEENGDVAMSEETAIVSVPEPGREGELLALVERPGAPSRLINTPEPEAGEAANAREEDMAEAEAPAAETETAMAEPAAEDSAQDAAGTEAAESEAEPAAEEAETASADAAEGAASGDATEVAEANAEAASETPAPAPEAARITIRIEAVEIDSDTIFVAGAADPGAQVRVYANEFLLGDTLTSPGGRFLVQVRRDLAVGDYIIRADVIDPATAEVVARAAVPFTRSEGERVAAVADNAATIEQPAEAADAAESAGSAPAEQSEAGAAEAEPSSEAAQAETMTEAEPETEASTAMAETPAASGEAVTGEADMAEAEQPAETATGEAASGEASTEPAMTEEPGTEDMATAEAETPAAEPAVETAEASAPAADTAETPAAGEEQVASAPESSAPPEVSEDITVTGELRQTNSSVIIRRGDTLWHISRRVYGQGTRYTTIYLANQDQIKDPDMIWPGQIFELPEEAKPEN